MDTLTPSHHKKLNTKQLDILRLLYRFRFATSHLLTQTLSLKDKSKMNQRLRILTKQEYIGRNYTSEYRLQGRHASYYLSTKGIKALKGLGDDVKYSSSALHNIYKDKAASNQFISHNLEVFATFCQLKNQYGDDLRFFTKNQLAKYDYFPNPLPDAYIRLNDKQFFLEILHSKRPFFIVTRRIKQYITYIENGAWQTTDSELPSVLLVCDNATLQKRLYKRIAQTINSVSDEIGFYTTTTDKLRDISQNEAIWHDISEPDEVLRCLPFCNLHLPAGAS